MENPLSTLEEDKFIKKLASEVTDQIIIQLGGTRVIQCYFLLKLNCVGKLLIKLSLSYKIKSKQTLYRHKVAHLCRHQRERG
jgi:hypothetical protein